MVKAPVPNSVHVPHPIFSSGGILGKLFKLCKPQSLHLFDGNNKKLPHKAVVRFLKDNAPTVLTSGFGRHQAVDEHFVLLLLFNLDNYCWCQQKWTHMNFFIFRICEFSISFLLTISVSFCGNVEKSWHLALHSLSKPCPHFLISEAPTQSLQHLLFPRRGKSLIRNTQEFPKNCPLTSANTC